MAVNNLFEEENSFRRLAENLPGIVYKVLIEDDNRMIFFNDMVQTMTGYSHEDLEKGIVCSIDPLILPEDKLNVLNIVKDAIENNVPFEVEYRICSKNGVVKWFFEYGRPIRGDNGNPSYIEGVIFDITYRKEVEKKLKTSEESLKRLNKELEQRLEERMIGLRESEIKFKTIFDESPIGIELYDSNGKLVDINESCLDIFGVSSIEDVRGFELFKNPNILEENLKKLEKGQIIRYETLFDFDLVKDLNLYETEKSGKIWIDVLISPLYLEENDTFSNYLVQLQDITAQKIAEQKLKAINEDLDNKVHERTKQLTKSEEQHKILSTELETILNHYPGLVFYKDTNNNFIRINQNVVDYYNSNTAGVKANLTRKDIEGQNIFDLLPKDIAQTYWDEDLEVIRSGIPKLNIEESFKTEHGIKWLNSNKTPYFDENGEIRGIIGFSIDITERNIAEKKLEESQHIFEQLNKVFLKFKQDPIFNLQLLINTAGLLLNADCALFNILKRVNGKEVLESLVTYNEPPNFTRESDPKGHICTDIIKDNPDDVVVLRNLDKTDYIKTDENVRKYDLKQYVSYVVRFNNKPTATFCVVYTENREMSKSDITIIQILSKSASTELARWNSRIDLQKSEEKYRYLFDNAQVGLYWSRITDGKILECNNTFAKLLGYDRREECLANYNTVEHSFDPNARSEILKEIRDNKEVKNYEIHVTRRDYTPIWLSISARMFEKENRIEGAAIDITERKQAERDLQLERDNFLNILTSMEDGVYIVDQNYNIEFVNPSLIKEFGQFEGMKCYKYFEDRNDICPRCKNKEVYQGKTVRGEWYSFKNQKTYDLIDTPLKKPDGCISKLGIFRDETDKKQAEKIIKESEETFRKQNLYLKNILESLTHPFYVINVKDYTVALANSTASPEGLGHGQRCYNLTHNNNKPCEAPCKCPLDEVIKTKNPCVTNHIHYDKEGNEKTYEICGYPIIDEDGNVVQMIEYEINITERKITQQELKESEKRYRLLFESSPIGIGLFDFEGNVLAMNQKMVEMTGFTLDDFKKTNLSDLYIDFNDPSNLFSKLKDIGKVRNYELKLKKKNGIIYDALLNIETLHMGGKNVFLINQEDITERKKTEQKLKKSEENYRVLFEDSPISLWEEDYSELKKYIDKLKNSGINDLRSYFDENPEEVKKCVSIIKIIDVNQETLELYKADKKEEFFGGLNQVFTEESFDTFKEQIINLAEGKTRFESEASNCTLDGDELFVFLVCEIVAGFQEDWSKVLISIVDISERKKAENDLRKIAHQWQTTFDAMSESVFLLDIENNILQCNKATLRILEKEKYDEIIGHSCCEIMHGTNEPVEWCPLVRTMESSHKESSIAQLGDRWCEFTVEPVFNDEGTLIGGVHVITDITESKKVEQELIKLNNMKSELLKRTSHELKTPLVSIKGFSDLLLELHRDKLDDYVIRTIKQIRMGCNRLESLVNDILKTAELESGTVKLKKKKEDLSLLMKRCVNELEGLSELRNHTISLEIPDKLIFSFEKDRIYNVITNILSNAIKFTPHNGKIEIKSEINNDFIIISIKDNGIGFLKEERSLIFKQFGKIERYGQGYDVISEGSGLGLNISKKIIEMHGGKIWLESEGRNKGSTFCFSLPMV